MPLLGDTTTPDPSTPRHLDTSTPRHPDTPRHYRCSQVHAINPEKKTFDRIDRLAARAETFEMELLIDINSGECCHMQEHLNSIPRF